MLRNWQLLLAGFWLAIAMAIALREPLGLNVAAYSERHWTMGLALSGMLALWNVVRWHTQRPVPKAMSPLKSQTEKPPSPYEYNEALDFQKMERDQSGKGG